MAKSNITLLLTAALLAAGCAGSFRGMPHAETLAYQSHGTYGALHTMATAYAEAINASVRADTLHPGLYADYGVALALMNHPGQACRMLNAEMHAFPESRPMVMRIKRQLLPDMVDDTLCGPRDTANLDQLASWAYDSLTALKPLPFVAPVIDSTDTAWLQQQTPVDSVVREIRLTANQKRELLAQEQMAAALAKQAHADSIAAAKQAKLDARKQAQAEKEKAKKEKQKAQKAKQKQNKQKQKELKKQNKQKQKASDKKGGKK